MPSQKLEVIFGSQEREVAIARHFLSILRPREPQNPMDLVDLIKEAAGGLREMSEKYESPHPVDYTRLFERLRQHGYIANPSPIGTDSKLVMTKSAKRFFDENYTVQ